MADRVFIGADDGAAGADLARCLGRHGLSAGLVRTGSGWQVEVSALGEDPRSFFADLGVALARWSGGGTVAGVSTAPPLDASGGGRRAPKQGLETRAARR